MRSGNADLWQLFWSSKIRDGTKNACIQPREDTCIVCTRKIAKHQQGHSIKGLPAHKKCMIAYTAWEVEQEHPGVSAGESRILQVRRHLENLYAGIESKR